MATNQALDIQDPELVRRQKKAATSVVGLLIATVLVSVIAYLKKGSLEQRPNPSLDIAVRITILVLGLGSVALRRTRFSALRLQDIGGLKGSTGLLITLERTTLQLAFLAAATATIGFIATLLTGNDFYTYGAGLVAIAIFFYCYPSRRAWARTVEQFGAKSDAADSSSGVA